MGEISLAQIKSVLLGAATGDAFGVPFEFLPASAVAALSMDAMRGADDKEPVNSRWGRIIPAGSWSDDTSMAVATMESIIHNDGELNLTNLMDRFVAWWENGEYCALDQPFGLGKTVAGALGRFKNGTDPLDCGGTRVYDNGNGALMRIFPVVLLLWRKPTVREENWETISKASRITHGHAISQLSCIIYSEFLSSLLDGKSLEGAYQAAVDKPYRDWRENDEEWLAALEAHQRVLDPSFLALTPADLTPSGYVVDTLEIVLHSLLRTESYREAIQTTVRLGGDTDTYAAIAGAAAGAYYGLDGIPREWPAKLKRRAYLNDLALRFHQAIKPSYSL